MVNSKAKGSQFERDICKSLSLWVTNNQKIDVFWRSAMSGGRATVSKGKVRQAGDITAVAPEGHGLTDLYYLECKHLKQISLDSLITEKGPLLTIWKDVVKKAASYRKFPLLVFRQNRWPIIVCSTFRGVELLHVHSRDVFCRAYNMHFVRFDAMIKRPYVRTLAESYEKIDHQ